MNAPPARILALEPDDAERIAQLAAEIWRHHYPGIISAAQIEYMLKQRYEPALIRRELRERGLWWDKLVSGEAIIGFASCFLTDETNDMKLDKLYVHRDWQRRGLGGRLIAQVCERARSSGCRRVILAVNRHNAGAIAAYLKYGFAIRGTRVADIGGGFVMDDYLMAREL
jgi:ribosomal protein S18 acetylase RimI-like enzyme